MAERIALQVALEGAEAVLQQLRGMERFANILDRKKIKLKADTSINDLKRNIDDLNRAMLRLDEEYDALKADAKAWHEISKSASVEERKQIDKELEGLRERRRENREQRKEAQLMKRQLQNTSRELANEVKANELRMPLDIDTTKADMKLGQIYNKWSGAASRFGASMITLGNTLQTITSPFDSILRGAMYGIGYGALGKVTEGLASSTSRYDTLKTYPKIMESLGFSSTKAEKSVDKLNESVLGLPTGLDEIVDMAKRYALATHDIEEGTDVAIAANNAFLASAATDQQKYQGMMQLNDVLSGKKLQSREWMSLAASMPAAMQEIGKLLGYTKNSEFLQALYGNKIDNKKFIKALKEVGNEGGKIAEMAEISKQTFAGLASNVKNAFSRGGYKVLDALDNILIKATGKGTVENFKKITDGIDGIFESAVKWMNANPDVIMDFFTRLKEFDWGGFVSGFGKGVLGAFEIFKKAIDFLSDKGIDASKVGTMMVKWNLIGKGLTIMGGSLKGLAPLIGGTGVLGKLIKSGAIGAFISKLITPLAKIGSAGAAVEGAETIANVGGAASKIPLSWQGVVSQASSIAAIPAVAFSFMEVAKAFKVLSTIGSWEGMGKKVLHCMEAIAVFVGEAAGIGALLTSTPAGWFAAVATGVGGVTMAGIAKVMQMSVKAVNDVANAEVPSTYKISAVIGSIKTMMTEMKDIDTTLPQGQKNVGDNAKGIAGVLEGIASMLTNTKAISEIEIGKKQIKQAKKSISEIRPMIEEMKEEIAQLYGEESFNTRTNHRGQKVETTHRNKFDSKALENAQTDSGGVNSILGNILEFVKSIGELNKKSEELKSIDVGTLKETIGGAISDMGEIAENIKQQSERLDGIKDAPERFTAMLKSIGSIKKILTKLQEMDESGIMASSTNRMLTLGNIIDQMSSALSKAGGGMINAAMFESMTASVKKGINNLNKINEVKIDFGGFEQTVASAVKVVKSATKKISKAWGKFKSATDEIKNISKTIFVAVHINGVDSAVAQMNSAASRLNAARANLNAAMNGGGGGGGGIVNPVLHTGGYLDGRGRVLYRASGGGVPLFKRKGMDTVPAMLTPGEYVNRRAAVAHFGVGFFERLNHLDLEGALRSISTRASRFAGGNTYNITNKTNNARVVQHIHTHDTNYAFKRANRFVEAL